MDSRRVVLVQKVGIRMGILLWTVVELYWF